MNTGLVVWLLFGFGFPPFGFVFLFLFVILVLLHLFPLEGGELSFPGNGKVFCVILLVKNSSISKWLALVFYIVTLVLSVNALILF